MDTYNLEEAKKQLGKMIASAADGRMQCRITSAHGNAVLLSEESYDNLLITLELLSTPGLLEGLQELQLEEEELSLVE